MRKIFLVLPILLALFVLVVLASDPLYGRTDFFQVGDNLSETEHNASGFGPVEPTTHGGGWGNIDTVPDPLGYSDKLTRVIWNGTASLKEDDSFENRGAQFTMTVAKKCPPLVCNRQWLRASRLKLRYLDGQANDDFIVLWKNPKGNWELLDVVVTDPSTVEYWRVHDINLVDKIPAQYRIGGGKQLTFKVVATGNSWSLFDTYGQVAFDYIWLEQ